MEYPIFMNKNEGSSVKPVLGETLQCYQYLKISLWLWWCSQYSERFAVCWFLLFLFLSNVVYKRKWDLHENFLFREEKVRMGITFLKLREQGFLLVFLQNVIKSACTTGCGDKLLVSNTDRFGLWCSWSWPEGGESTIYIALQVQFVSFCGAAE